MLGLAVHHLALRTRDLPRLVEFYTHVLALPLVRETAGYSVWLRAGEAFVMLEQAGDDEPAVPAGSRELVAFAVTAAGRDAVRERLAARGVALDGETGFTTYFRDPDGRRVGVSTYPLTLEPGGPAPGGARRGSPR